MEELLEGTRGIGAEYNDNPYLCVSNDLRNRLLSGRLYMLAVAEYATLSKEYIQIMKEGIHYIGRLQRDRNQSFVEGGHSGPGQG